MELKEIALEVARELSEEGFSGTGTDYTLAFYPRFLAAVDAERGKDAVGYDEIFNAIAEAASPCGEGIGVSVKAFKRAIGGEIFLSPTIPQWQPIETAPKDGSRLMLLFPGDRQEFGYWDDQRYNKNPAPYWNGDCDRVFGVRYYRAKQPTHWMPLPPPPAGVMK